MGKKQRGKMCINGFEDEGRDHEPKLKITQENAWNVTLDSGNNKRTDCPLVPLEGVQSS